MPENTRRHRPAALLTAAAVLVPVLPASAAPVYSSVFQVSVPAGSENDTGSAYTDDVFLESLNFGGAELRFDGPTAVGVAAAYVTAGRDMVNAGHSEQDTGRDGNPNPFVASGAVTEGSAVSYAVRESTDPLIQDAAIRAAFNNRSLIEGIDGEGGDYTVNLVFDRGLTDNNSAADGAPELVFFERGMDSDFSVRAILGGTLDSPTLSDEVTVSRAQLQTTGIFIDTAEAPGPQQLGLVGFDLNDFNLAAGAEVYGVQIASLNGSGADIFGSFLTATDTAQLVSTPASLASLPEPGALALVAAGGGLMLAARRGQERV